MRVCLGKKVHGDIKGTLLGEKWWVDNRWDERGEEINVHGQTCEKQDFFCQDCVFKEYQ